LPLTLPFAANGQDTSRTSHRNDPRWKHCHLMNESNLNTNVCNYCGKVAKVGITRAKEHLKPKKGNVVACTKTPKNVRKELWKLFKEKTGTPTINHVCSVVAYDSNE